MLYAQIVRSRISGRYSEVDGNAAADLLARRTVVVPVAVITVKGNEEAVVAAEPSFEEIQAAPTKPFFRSSNPTLLNITPPNRADVVARMRAKAVEGDVMVVSEDAPEQSEPAVAEPVTAPEAATKVAYAGPKPSLSFWAVD